MKYTLIRNAMADTASRNAYNTLATAIFGLSFENWYNSGHFSGNHIPYTLMDGEKAVANISVNTMDVLYNGTTRKYLQLGTVMTDPAHRGKGLQKQIFNEIIKDFSGKYDGLFLFANKSVLDFYPKLNFERADYYNYSKTVAHKPAQLKKLDMSNGEDVAFLKKYYTKGNPFSALQVVNNSSLLMFYCGSFFADFVYYIPQYDAVVIAGVGDNSMTCYGIYCDGGSMDDILSAFPVEKANLGFTPTDTTGCEITKSQDDDTALFIHTTGENIFTQPLLFPEFFHT